MTKQEVIERFCKLSALVGESMKQKYAQDCFCADDVHSNHPYFQSFFQYEKQVMEYIEQAVEEKMLQEERDKEFLSSISIDAPSDYQHY